MSDQTEPNSSSWTIMMYIQADDALANFAVESLRQLKHAASDNVVIAAQFDAKNRSNIPRYIFKGKDPDNHVLAASLNRLSLTPSQHSKALLAKDFISANIKDEIPRDTNMADPHMLCNFIDWACDNCTAEHYCLVVWGHGPELLLDDYLVPGSVKRQKSFLSPVDLGKALAEAKKRREAKEPKKIFRFDVVGIDACCMSMLEAAYEIQEYARFLVASQEDVPDFSFPYEAILTAFSPEMEDKSLEEQKWKEKLRNLCENIPRLYAYAYQEYILDKQTNMESISLSSLSLEHLEDIKDYVKELGTKLQNLTYDETTRQLLIEARAGSKGFVAGLYVDLYDFCEQLRSRLMADNADNALASVCDKICDAIRSRVPETACVIENQAPQNKHCHGLSLYFPYLTAPEKITLEAPLAPLVKGGLDNPNKGGLDAPHKSAVDTLNQSGTDMLNRVRRQRIAETEAYYRDLKFSKVTQWDEFIGKRWTRCLVENAELMAKLPGSDVSDLLDEQYSAQQCALNLLSWCRELEKPVNPSPPAGPGSAERHKTGETRVTVAMLSLHGNDHGS